MKWRVLSLPPLDHTYDSFYIWRGKGNDLRTHFNFSHDLLIFDHQYMKGDIYAIVIMIKVLPVVGLGFRTETNIIRG
ncbi:MAG: hypothetical protein H7Y03_07280 [Chitinophagaceae bacterium]|nr:hypothetical protein [Chitinophagaceae bacterium]